MLGLLFLRLRRLIALLIIFLNGVLHAMLGGPLASSRSLNGFCMLCRVMERPLVAPKPFVFLVFKLRSGVAYFQ